MRDVKREFTDTDAKRERVPVLLGIVGPSGSGKTKSALRIADGIRGVVGGEVFGADSESRRMLMYAGKHKFRHVPFGAPFSPLDYLAMIAYCVKKGAKTLIIDSMSHEHEGPGGVLEIHEEELQRLSGGDASKAHKFNMLAWARPKAERRRLLNSILQMDLNVIFCFRAKEKLRIVPGQNPVELGYQPQAGEEFIYEMTLNLLLLPGSEGTPTTKSDYPGERAMVKIPEHFRDLLATPRQLDEDFGAKLAQWAAGTDPGPMMTTADLIVEYGTCSDAATYRTLEATRERLWPTLKKEEKPALKDAADKAKVRLDWDAASRGPDGGE